MISMSIVFWLFIIIFALNGAMRGWAKEMLVSFSVIVGMAFIAVLENLIPMVSATLRSDPTLDYYVRLLILAAVAFFGYQSPRFARINQAVEKRDRISDLFLGFLLGALSGYMVIGTLWSYSNTAGYPFIQSYVIPPSPQVPGGDSALWLLERMPPEWLGASPNIYIAVVVAFVCVIVLFI